MYISAKNNQTLVLYLSRPAVRCTAYMFISALAVCLKALVSEPGLCLEGPAVSVALRVQAWPWDFDLDYITAGDIPGNIIPITPDRISSMGEYQFSNFLQRADISRELARGLQCCHCCPRALFRNAIFVNFLQWLFYGGEEWLGL